MSRRLQSCAPCCVNTFTRRKCRRIERTPPLSTSSSTRTVQSSASAPASGSTTGLAWARCSGGMGSQSGPAEAARGPASARSAATTTRFARAHGRGAAATRMLCLLDWSEPGSGAPGVSALLAGLFRSRLLERRGVQLLTELQVVHDQLLEVVHVARPNGGASPRDPRLAPLPRDEVLTGVLEEELVVQHAAVHHGREHLPVRDGHAEPAVFV